jgi:hypothetical protein
LHTTRCPSRADESCTGQNFDRDQVNVNFVNGTSEAILRSGDGGTTPVSWGAPRVDILLGCASHYALH